VPADDMFRQLPKHTSTIERFDESWGAEHYGAAWNIGEEWERAARRPRDDLAAAQMDSPDGWVGGASMFRWSPKHGSARERLGEPRRCRPLCSCVADCREMEARRSGR